GLLISTDYYDYYSVFFFFFFQAEDGIRDDLVTGVQTCALPISLLRVGRANLTQPVRLYASLASEAARRGDDLYTVSLMTLADDRSEERRVGKECRSWWWGYH